MQRGEFAGNFPKCVRCHDAEIPKDRLDRGRQASDRVARERVWQCMDVRLRGPPQLVILISEISRYKDGISRAINERTIEEERVTGIERIASG
jgi:hypothetical protein